jgi:hypothetical protein
MQPAAQLGMGELAQSGRPPKATAAAAVAVSFVLGDVVDFSQAATSSGLFCWNIGCSVTIACGCSCIGILQWSSDAAVHACSH